MHRHAERYALHALVRQFARQQVAEWPESATLVAQLQARHSAYYLQWVNQWAPHLHTATVGEALAQLRREQENIHAAWLWAAQTGQNAALQSAPPGLVRFWVSSGLFREGEALIRQALPHADALRPALLIEQARLLQHLDEYARAANVLAEAQTFALSAPLQAAVCVIDAALFWKQRDFARATAQAQQAHALYSELAEPAGLMESLNLLGMLASYPRASPGRGGACGLGPGGVVASPTRGSASTC